MAQLAAFPKCFLDDIVDRRTMSLFDWIELGAQLPHVAGLETYHRTLESLEPKYLGRVQAAMENYGLQMPMMCAAPDFTQRDAVLRTQEIEAHKRLIEATAILGGRFCRVLSGQKRPDVSRAEGIAWTVEAIHTLLPQAQECGVVMTMENHYKDAFWLYPEFAQAQDVFLEIVAQIDSPYFGLNYDPSNALIAGDDPVDFLEAIKERVVTMHASDRSLEGGTWEELRRMDRDPQSGYAAFVKHGVIGRGLIDYDRIFAILQEVNFGGWISIEDGPDPEVGMEHLSESAEFLWRKMRDYGLDESQRDKVL